jgi:hypothetical protein
MVMVPARVGIPHDRPRDVDDDDFEYRGRLTDALPDGLPIHRKRLRVQALIVDPRTDRVIEAKDTSVKRG